MFVSFFRVLKFACQDFYRNFWLSIVTISVLMLALFSVNILIGLNAVSESIIAGVEQKVDISILISKNATAAEIGNFKLFVENIDGAASVEYQTKEQVKENFRQRNIDNPEIQQGLQELQDNPFNDTFIIKARQTTDYARIIQSIQSSDYHGLVENKNFSDPQKIIAAVENFTGKAEQFGLLLTVIFAIIALLIVFNTIRVTIYTHKEEIGVMRLVGATNWFIRTPYLLEGIMFAVIALAFKIMILYSVLNVIQPHMGAFLESYGADLTGYFNANFIQIFGLELVIVILLNTISSGFAIRRYLKV